MADPESPFRIERTDDGVRFTFDVTAQPTERQRKLARFDHFEIPCDEGAVLGGDDSAPPPLAYFASALAF
ncbi:MAG: hypothetical protein AAGA93_15070 [Actinomycetota bacterium]